MYYKLIIIILIILVLLFIYKNKNKDKEIENFDLTEVLYNMASVYEESDGTLSFQNLKASGDTELRRLIVNRDFLIRGGLVNNGANGINNTNGNIVNSGTGGIINTGSGGIKNTGKFINNGDTAINGKLNVDGDISGNLVGLRGMILMWYGSTGSIPEGWKICDGQTYNGITTPDLRSRFIIGASPTGAGPVGLTARYWDASGTKGGAETHQLSIDEMPSHTHHYNKNIDRGIAGSSHEWETDGSPHTNNGGLTSYTGNNQPHNNMPPYYALAYIMKI